MHRQTDVLQGDTDFEVLVFTRHILDTGIDGEARGLGVGNTLVDNLDGDTALDEVVEGLGVVQADVGECGAECTQTAFRLLRGGNRNITEALGEEGDGNHTEISLFAKFLGDGHRIDGNAAIGTHQILGSVEGKLRFADSGQTGDIGEHGLQSAHLSHTGAGHTACASPRVNQQVGSTCLT